MNILSRSKELTHIRPSTFAGNSYGSVRPAKSSNCCQLVRFVLKHGKRTTWRGPCAESNAFDLCARFQIPKWINLLPPDAGCDGTRGQFPIAQKLDLIDESDPKGMRRAVTSVTVPSVPRIMPTQQCVLGILLR